MVPPWVLRFQETGPQPREPTKPIETVFFPLVATQQRTQLRMAKNCACKSVADQYHEQQQQEYERLFFRALYDGELETLRRMLQGSPRLGNATDALSGEKALFWAVKFREFEIIRLLLSYGACPDIQIDATGSTPLAMAAMWNDDELVRLLLTRSSANVNTQNIEGETPLLLLSGQQYHDGILVLVSSLLKHGADVNKSDNVGNTPLTRSIEQKSIPLMKLLLRNGANTSSSGGQSEAPLIVSVRSNCMEAVALLLEEDGIDCNVHCRSHSRTPLIWAAFLGLKDIFVLLLNHPNVDIHAQDKNRNTALMMAVGRRPDIIRCLVEQGAKVYAHNQDDDSSPLERACFYGHLDSIFCLIRYSSPDQWTLRNESDVGDGEDG